MLPHSYFLGHLAEISSVKDQLPSDAHAIHLMTAISQKFPSSEPVYYLDLWSVGPPLMILASPHTADQVIQPNE